MAILEVFTFDATDAYIADPVGTWKDLTESHSGLNGLLSFHHGLQIENPSKCTCFITWDNLDSFHAVTVESRQSARVKMFSLAIKDSKHSQLFDVGMVDLSKFSRAPVTEITIIKLKKGKTRKDLAPMFRGFKMIEPSPSQSAHEPAVGWSLEEQDTFVILMGWDKVEDHLNFIQNNPNYAAVAKTTQPLVEFSGMHHVRLIPVELEVEEGVEKL